MKIRSRFTDYYDHISTCYGADPDVLYLRDEPPKVEKLTAVRRAGAFVDTFERRAWGGLRGTGKKRVWVDSDYEMQFLIAGPRYFAFAYHKPSGRTVILGPEHEPLLLQEYDWRAGRKRKRTEKPRWPVEPTEADLKAAIRQVGKPVFLLRGDVERRHSVEVVWETPRLADLGIPAIVSADQMLQDIYSTLTNVLRVDPDKAPPVQVEEKYRIEAAGFDLKTSFRHPVNPRPRKSESRR